MNKTDKKENLNENMHINNNKLIENAEDIENILDNNSKIIIYEEILNTLRTIENNTKLNMDIVFQKDYENLPGLLGEIQNALSKSNNNIFELKSIITELLNREVKLRNKIRLLKAQIEIFKNKGFHLNLEIDKLTNDNLKLTDEFYSQSEWKKKYDESNYIIKTLKKKDDENERKFSSLNKDIESKDRVIAELNDIINKYRKSVKNLNQKNKIYVDNNYQLQNEISNFEVKLDEINEFKDDIKDLNAEIISLKEKIIELSTEKEKFIEIESKYKHNIDKLKDKNRKIKEDLKTELTEKILMLKEIERMKDSQLLVHEKQENLKQMVECTANEKEKYQERILYLENDIKFLTDDNENKDREIEILKNENIILIENNKTNKFDLENLKIETEKLNKEIIDLKIKVSSEEARKIEETIFLLSCEVNLWKNAFLEIVRYKQLNYDEELALDKVAIDFNYINNAPNELKERVNEAFMTFKSAIEDESFHSKNIKYIKEALYQEQEKNMYLKTGLVNELNLRRKVHNRYMTLRGNLRIMCRIRPFIKNENVSLIKKGFLESFKTTNETIFIDEKNKTKKFNLDYVFNQKSSQQEVYDEASLLIQTMQKGSNICIIAYGQTGTGKTYTIQGPNKENCGIAVRAVKEIFEMIDSLNLKGNFKTKDSNKGVKAKLSISIVEIYNENIIDLLAEEEANLNMYENSNGNLIIPDLKPIKISNFSEAAKLFKLAERLRHSNSTQYNDRSSRSHCIFSFFLKIVDGDHIIRSKLNILDLAGSERLSKSVGLMDETQRRETTSINLSLNSLANVLNAIASKQSHIPYRDSKLTHFLKESLTDSFIILMILHVSPNLRDLGETISTLEFGKRIAKICKYKIGKEKINK